MSAVLTNTRPSYYVTPYIIPPTLGNPKRVPGRFTVNEYRDGQVTQLFHVAALGLTLNDILKRGIPLEDAKSVFYQITSPE